jgi:hypothetical protein
VSRRRGKWTAAAALAALVAGVGLLYLWLISAGKITSWPEYTAKYDLLADAFLHGQTHLLVRPAPELLALPDPYDPAANAPYRLHDALLYRGRYYLYWGAAPAVLAAAVKGATGVATVGDAPLVFAFVLGVLVFVTLFLLEVRRQFFPGLRWGALLPGILAVGLGNPLPFLLARAGVYEAAITGGQCFLIAGLYCAVRALRGWAPRATWLALAGVCWSLAVHSRVSLAPAVVALALLLAWRLCQLGRAPGQVRRCLIPLAALGAPLAAGAFLLGLYNHVRFGSWTEFGVRYQLAGMYMPAWISVTQSVHYVLPNVQRYLFCPPQLSESFPFVVAPWRLDPLGLLAARNIPYYLQREPVAGICLTSPFALLAAAPLILLACGLAARLRRGAASSGPHTGTRWVVLLLACAALLGIAPALLLIGNSMRYLADATPALFLLATLGFWQVYELLASRRVLRLLWLGTAGLLVTATILCGVLLGVTGYYGHFRANNPELFQALKNWTLPRWKPVVLADLVNGNWVESRRGRAFFWMGQGDTVLDVRARRRGTLRLTATFECGPSGPDTPARQVLVATDGGFTRVLTIPPGRGSIRVPVRWGRTTVILRPLDPPVHRHLPDGDQRPLLVGVWDLRLHLEKLGPAAVAPPGGGGRGVCIRVPH